MALTQVEQHRKDGGDMARLPKMTAEQKADRTRIKTARKQQSRLMVEFWRQANNGADRLSLLCRYAAIKLDVPPEQPKRTRTRYENWKRAGGGLESAGAGACWCCAGETERRSWHHVIQVQHGAANSRKAMVPVCDECHRAIHPWMKSRV
jgi:hypothetical protein